MWQAFGQAGNGKFFLLEQSFSAAEFSLCLIDINVLIFAVRQDIRLETIHTKRLASTVHLVFLVQRLRLGMNWEWWAA
jgi:hypothetical protein